jgi:putative transcriptional regulator
VIKNRLLDLRLQKGFKFQKDFASYLEISRPQYSKYENNVEQPSIEILYKIAKKLNIKIDDIVYESE